MLDKTYRPAEIEAKFDRLWQESGLFAPSDDPDARPYCIVIPPPNVTGSLHMGHALNNTIQDTLIRFQRMSGRAVLWQPGSDHAGIATQMVVERELAKEGVTRRDLGRERFVERVWAWKQRSGGLISRQLHRLGASADWSRERFTMDEGLSSAVRKVFVDLHRKGLIYKDKRLVNWDCQLQTAVSDLEVEATEVDGHLWYIRYPIEGAPGRHVTVATTRPETMLGDTGVAVHPDDPRYRDLIGKHAILPLVGRRLPIVADAYSDPEKGSGAVKITPGHDFNDFEVGRRHDLAMINIMDARGCLNEEVPEPYRGLDRFVARERVLADLEAQGLIEKTQPIRHAVPLSQRSETPVEPILSDQWYADAKTLAQAAIEAVEQGRTRFVPEQWAHTYFEWMRNIQPWCISRQLWWGHQIPAWYGPDGEIFVAMDEAEAHDLAAKHYGRAGRAGPRRGRARHLVLLRALAVLDARLARADARARALLSHRRPGHRLRHHLLLGRPDDDDGPRVHGRGAVSRGLHPRPGARRARPEDVQEQGQRDRPARADREVRRRRAALCAAWPARSRAATSSSARGGSRATGTSGPSCGTRRAFAS